MPGTAGDKKVNNLWILCPQEVYDLLKTTKSEVLQKDKMKSSGSKGKKKERKKL